MFIILSALSLLLIDNFGVCWCWDNCDIDNFGVYWCWDNCDIGNFGVYWCWDNCDIGNFGITDDNYDFFQVCAPNDLCYCDSGWEGSDCSTRANVTFVEDGSQAQDNETDSFVPSTTSEAKAIALSEYEGGLVRGSLYGGGSANTPATAPITDGKGIEKFSLKVLLRK